MEQHPQDPFFERQDVQCATECTGLIPAAPETAEEETAQAALMAIHNAAPRRRRARHGSAE